MRDRIGFASALSAVVGFAASVFLYTWAGALPHLFGDQVLTAGWTPIVGSVGILLAWYHFGRRARPAGSQRRMRSLAVLAFGLAGVPVWQLLRMTAGIPGTLMDAGLLSTWSLTAVMSVTTFVILLVPGYAFGVFLTCLAKTPSNSPGRDVAPGILWPLFLGFAAGSAVLVFGMLHAMTEAACTFVAAGVAAVTGLIGLATGKGVVPEETVPGAAAPAHAEGHPGLIHSLLRVIYLFAAFTWIGLGFRLCLIALGSSLQAATALYILIFVGLAVGSAIAAWGAGRMEDPAVALGILAGATGILFFLIGRWSWRLPLVFLDTLGGPPLVWEDLLGSYFGTGLLALLAPAVLVGISLDMAPGLGRSAGWERWQGRMAAVVPALLAAFVATRLIPAGGLGFAAAMSTASWICAAVGIAYFASSGTSPARRLAWTAPFMALTLLLGLNQPERSGALFARGIHAMPVEFKKMGIPEARTEGRTLLFEEGDRDMLITVDRLPDAVTLRIDGNTRESAEAGMVPYLLTGHIPLLLGRDTGKVLVDGFDAGLTVHAVETYPVDEIDCVEPSASVLRAAAYFSAYNRNASDDPRLVISEKDIWNYLLYSDARYDIVILKSPTPYSPAGADRLTSGFFSLVRSRTAPDAIVCQQLNTFEFSASDLKSIAKTFAGYFPQVTVWWAGGDKILLLGSSQPLHFAQGDVRERMSRPDVQTDLAKLKFTDPLGILSCFLMRRDDLMTFAGNAVRYQSGSRDAALDWAQRTVQLVRTDGLEDLALNTENPVVLLGDLDTGSLDYKIIRDQLERCVKARKAFINSLVLLREDRIQEAVTALSDGPVLCPLNGIYPYALADYCVIYSRSLLTGGRIGDAVGAGRRAVELLPSSPRTFYNLAYIELNRDPDTAIALLDRATQLNPYYIPAYLLKARAQLASDRAKDAAQTVGEVLTMEPFNTEAHLLRGLSLTRRRMYAEGRTEFRSVLDAEPDNLEAMEGLAYTWLMEDDLDKAEDLYRRILRQDPDHLGALNNYATILAEKEHYREAIEVWTRALKLSPGNKNIEDNIEEARGKLRK
jgi:tetratricopeptide (TPR) repeat protein